MKNYYIERDKKKNIVSTFARPQYEDQEFLPETDNKIIAYLKKQKEIIVESQKNEQKIKAKMRQMAVEALKADKELPAGFEG